MRRLTITTLPSKKEWVDKDVEMYHACFQLLVNAIEKEKVHLHICQKVHKEFVDEVVFLHLWWKQKIIQSENSGEFDVNDSEADEMLLRLMKIRKSLWT